MKRVVAASVFGAVLLGVVGVSFADDPITVNPSTGPAGTTFTVSGTGCSPESFSPGEPFGETTVTVIFRYPEGETIATTTVTPDQTTGAWSTMFTAPEGAAPGSYPIDAVCDWITNGQEFRTLQQQQTSRNYERGYFVIPPVVVQTPDPDPNPDESEPAEAGSVQPTFVG